jgi:hypothetical protein
LNGRHGFNLTLKRAPLLIENAVFGFIKIKALHIGRLIRSEMFDVFYVWRLIYNIAGLAVIMGLVYYSVRLLQTFKGGIVGKSWLYVSYGVLTLAIGLILFIFHSLLNLPTIVYQTGNTIVLVGGLLILIGFYRQYKIWSQTD